MIATGPETVPARKARVGLHGSGNTQFGAMSNGTVGSALVPEMNAAVDEPRLI
jgi:hypothetical protein